MIVGIIIARGGSERIPGKNIKPFLGRPIIEYPIEAAQKSGLFDRIIISTDSPEIAQVARAAGVEVPFMRPGELADNFVATAPVLAHAIKQLEADGEKIQYACGIYATACLLEPRYLQESLEILRRTGCSTVMPVTKFDFPIYRGMKLNDSGKLEMLWPEHELTRSNDLPETYHDAGQFYWVEPTQMVRTARMWGPNTQPIILPRRLVVDIDTSEDWELAELMYQAAQAMRDR